MSLDKLEDSTSIDNTFDRQYILRVVLIVMIIVGLLVGGILYFSGSEDEPTGEESFNLQYTDSGVIITQTNGAPVGSNAQIKFNYYDGSASTHNFSVSSLSQSQIITTNRDIYEIDFVEVEWVYDSSDRETIYTEPLPEKYEVEAPNITIPDLNVRTMELRQVNAQEYIKSQSEIVSYNWSITGKSDKSGQVVDLQFSETGIYSGELSVTDELGNQVTESFTVTVESPNLITDVSIPNEVTLGKTVNLDATEYTSAQATDFSWVIEGVSYNTPTVSHKFTEPGISEVKLTVSDSFNYEVQKTYEVIVTETQDIDISVESNTNGNVVLSSNLDENIVSYEWTFGDGQTETTTDSVVNHKYESSGSYSVTVVATTSSGETVVDIVSVDINVGDENEETEEDSDSTADTIEIAIDSTSGSWMVNSISGTSTDQVLPNNDIGDQNPDIQLIEGQRYTFKGLKSTNPIEFKDLFGNVLLSQETSTPYEDAESINWVDNGNSVTFTLAPAISSSIDTYQSYNDSSMNGKILVISDQS
jgi:PKD repeat protein